MSKNLVIVESPTKARTIQAILGEDYEVSSSMGHVVDLPSRSLAVDIDKDFSPRYKVIPGKEKIISQLRKKAKDKGTIYLATDPDREGEAISWHIKDKLSKKGINFYRVVFHEITESALKEAFAHPATLDMNKVNAQIARRVLDRIVGYFLSPFLWKKVVRGLSAGRVQSVALKFIVEREKEIEDFTPKTTYGIVAKFKIGQDLVEAKLENYKGKKANFATIAEAKRCIAEIQKDDFYVKEVIKKVMKHRPPSPLTTSLLQQNAFTKFHFPSRKTMFIAQKLYEGVKINAESVGLITYMRTDSFHIAPKAKKEVKEFILEQIGQDYLSPKEYYYKAKKAAQLAHEAIRPTSVYRKPEDLEPSLTADEAKLYELIWVRFVASFMKEAVLESTDLILASKDAEFVAEGKKIIFAGYQKILGRSIEDKILPAVKQGERVELTDCKEVEHTTKPPPRFNDASIVKLLEDKGIGRPSTYAPTISTLFKRDYIRREKNAFFATKLGITVSELLAEHFPQIINENFTALMEEQLDEVEEGKVEWHQILREFYPSFKERVDRAATLVKKEVEFTDKTCPKCKSPLVIKWSRKGRFLSCSRFPECRYAESITTGIKCPQCKVGELIERRNKRGQFFYGCTNFPQCRYTSRNLPRPLSEDSTMIRPDKGWDLPNEENRNSDENET